MTPDQALADLLRREEIRELATRYSVAVDSRDLDTLASLWDDEVEHGKAGRGREAAKAFFADYFAANPAVTLHMVANHQIDFLDDDHATGVCYIRVCAGTDGVWSDRLLVYFDGYLRRDGRWRFTRRKVAPMVRLSSEQAPPEGPFRIPEAWARYLETRRPPD